jgi:Arc/MetJ-type ribon-helix-helix transcriptional regulator
MMQIDIPQDLFERLRVRVSASDGDTEADVIRHALDSLECQEQLHDVVNQGIDQLDAGEVTEYDDDSLRERFEQIKSDGRKRLAEREAGQ